MEIEYDTINSYHTMLNDWGNLFTGGVSIPAMFDVVDENATDWIVKYPNFKSDKPIVSGTFDVVIKDRNRRSVVMNSPTWADIAKFFSMNNDGHHIYIENIEIGSDTITIVSGS